jgi:hypothetical protein
VTALLPIVVELVNLGSVFVVPETATDVPLEPLVPDVPLLPDVPLVPLVPLVPDVPEEPDVPELPTEATDITKFKLVVPNTIGFGVFKIKILSPVVVPELMYV